MADDAWHSQGHLREQLVASRERIRESRHLLKYGPKKQETLRDDPIKRADIQKLIDSELKPPE